jgi:hypothetical protein
VARGERIDSSASAAASTFTCLPGRVLAEAGQTAIGGETVLAEFVRSEEARELSSVIGSDVAEE